MPRLFEKKEEPKPEVKPEEKVEEKEEIGTIGAINQQSGYYVASSEGNIPCDTIAQAKMLSILLKIEKQL